MVEILVCIELQKQNPAHNTHPEAKIIQSIQRKLKEHDAMVTRADKGNTMVILPTHQQYLLTPWCRVLLGKPTGLQLVKKFPAFHRTRKFISALTSVRQLSLSWANPIQSIYPHPISLCYVCSYITEIFVAVFKDPRSAYYAKIFKTGPLNSVSSKYHFIFFISYTSVYAQLWT